MIKKRIIYFLRDIQGLSCELFIPIILFIIGYLLTTIKMVKDSPSIVMDSTTYPFQFNINDYYNQKNMTQVFLDHIQPQNFEASVLKTKDVGEFDLKVFEKNSTD